MSNMDSAGTRRGPQAPGSTRTFRGRRSRTGSLLSLPRPCLTGARGNQAKPWWFHPIRTMRRYRRDDPHGLAHLGAMQAACWSMKAGLRAAAAEIDADPLDLGAQAKVRALTVRHVV